MFGLFFTSPIEPKEQESADTMVQRSLALHRDYTDMTLEA